MAIQAIHAVYLMLRRVAVEIVCAVFGALTLRISYAHPRDRFGIFTTRDVFDLISDVHVPMNTAHRTARWFAAAYIQ
jgi:hypothetical protein